MNQCLGRNKMIKITISNTNPQRSMCAFVYKNKIDCMVKLFYDYMHKICSVSPNF